jgi:hypothetical protein
MKVNGKVYLGGFEPSIDGFVWVSAHKVEPDVEYFITDQGEFEMYDYSGISEIYATDAANNGEILDDMMSDYEVDDILLIIGSRIIELAGDKCDTFLDVYYAYYKNEREGE